MSAKLCFPTWQLGLAAAIVTVFTLLVCPTARAAQIGLAYLSYDVTTSTFAEFDIANETGPNASSPNFPVTSTVTFTGLSLDVKFSDGSSTVFGPSYFTLDSDGESLDGTQIPIGGGVVPISATLTGDLSSTTIDVAGIPTTVDSSFDPAVITDTPTLVDGDLAVIYAETAGGSTPVPEPAISAPLVGVGWVALLVLRRRGRRGAAARAAAASLRVGLACGAVLALAGLPRPATASELVTDVQQNVLTTPSTGVAGVSSVNITGLGVPLPAPTIAPGNVTIKLAPTCTVGATTPVAGEVDAVATRVTTIIGDNERFNFALPAALAQGTYYAQLYDPNNAFVGANCSIVTVTKTSKVLNACVPTSSLGLVAGTKVTAYVPNGSWSYLATGVVAVPIEGGGTTTSIATPNPVNSCAGNPATGQVVCTANNTDVYLIGNSPPALQTTLTSGLTGTASFSGGDCNNCGVAVNALNNTAAINGGLLGSPSGDGVQILNLNTNTFSPAFATNQTVSEDISIDPGRGLILSPDEDGNYMLLTTNTAGGITGELDNQVSVGEFDSAAEDCSTSLALSSDEFTENVYLTDLTQLTTAPGTPPTWKAPSTLASLSNFAPGFSAGTDGISVAQGSSHLAIVTGEFGGNTFAILQLPATSGTGGAAPALVDFAGGTMPPTPSGTFQAGCDPHTVTAYTSPNTGKAIGLYTSYNTSYCTNPSWIGVIDMAAALAAPRSSANTIDPTYDLIAHGVVSYVKIQ